MGTKVQIENYLPGHCSMRDVSRESNGASWPSCYGDNNLSNGQLYYGFLPRTVADSHPGYDKDVVKQTMLEHEAVFKNQVYELHRLYRVQRDLMDEARRKDPFNRRIPYETSSSSSPVPSHIQSDDIHNNNNNNINRWNGSSLPLANSFCGGRPPTNSGPDTVFQSSPLSTKGKSVQASPNPGPFQNCYNSPKKSEVSESRPTKFRRMLDLQLPADEYIDTDEVCDNNNMSPSTNGHGRYASGNGEAFLNCFGKTECHGNGSRSDLRVSKAKALADLNEPLDVEETTPVSSLDFLGRSAKFLSSSKDVLQNSRHESLNGAVNNLHFENRPNGQDWFCYAVESEQHKVSMRSINHGILPEMDRGPSLPVRILPDQASQPPIFLTGNHIKADQWKAKPGGNAEKSERSYSLSSYNIQEPRMASHVPNQTTSFHPSELGKSWDHCASHWGKPGSCLSQVQTGPYLSKSSHSSAQSNDLFGNKWNLNNSPSANAAFGSEPPPVRNGVYQGSSASFKELPGRFPQVGYDYVNCNNINNNSDKTMPCSSSNYFKAAAINCTDVNPIMKDMNLNVPLPNGLSNDLHTSHQQDVKIKSEDPLAVLPWLRGKGGQNSMNGHPNSIESALFRSSVDDVKARKKPEGNTDCPSSRKILGVPIFDNPPVLMKEKKNTTTPVSERKGGFDMNLPCELADCEPALEEEVVVVVEEEKKKKKMLSESASFRNNFDLNSCITEEEMPCEITFPDNNATASVKGETGIDLEAPVILENEETLLLDEEVPSSIKEQEKQLELPTERAADDGEAELATSAAEAIVAISASVNLNQPEQHEANCHVAEGASSSESEDPLQWFVDIACSTSTSGGCLLSEDCLPEGLDDFELMTLRLKECDEDEYFPKPSIPEFPKSEENNKCLLTTRTRKGHARRGRQRRDFQRDILPGLTSLSRHEVTEDLQTFGGLMRATGHPWQSGPNRRNATRNGCGRGRRRSVAATPAPVTTTVCPPPPLKQQQQQQQQQQLLQVHGNNTEVGLEDRSLRGWGKTTRRPRRQRYPAGNPPPPVPLT